MDDKIKTKIKNVFVFIGGFFGAIITFLFSRVLRNRGTVKTARDDNKLSTIEIDRARETITECEKLNRDIKREATTAGDILSTIREKQQIK